MENEVYCLLEKVYWAGCVSPPPLFFPPSWTLIMKEIEILALRRVEYIYSCAILS